MLLAEIEEDWAQNFADDFAVYSDIITSLTENRGKMYSETLRLAFAIAYLADQKGLVLDRGFAFLGEELGIPAHLVEAFGLEILPYCGGGDDIDLITLDEEMWGVLAELSGGSYEQDISGIKDPDVSDDKWSVQVDTLGYTPSIPDYDRMKVDVDLWVPFQHKHKVSPVISFGRRTLDDKFFSERVQAIPVPLFGIQVCVPDVYALMDLRLNFADARDQDVEIRPKDMQMILDLTTVLAAQGVTAQELYNKLDPKTDLILKKRVYDCYMDQGPDVRVRPTIEALAGQDDSIDQALKNTKAFIEDYCRI